MQVKFTVFLANKWSSTVTLNVLINDRVTYKLDAFWEEQFNHAMTTRMGIETVIML